MSSDGGPINMGGPYIVQAAPKVIMGPPVITPGSEKNMPWSRLGTRLNPMNGNIFKVADAPRTHERGNRKLFSTYKAYNGGNVIFGSNLREPKNVNEALTDEIWIVAMQEELNQFIANDVWELVPQPIHTLSECVCLCARFQEDPKTSHLEAVKRIFRYIKGTTHLGLWYPKGTGIETVVYVDSDHAGDYVDRKSTSGICKFVGCCLTYWFSKKQTSLAISTTEAEYVSAEKACQHALWMKQALIDYDVRFDDVPIMCDNKGVIGLSKNQVQHSRTKHIEIRHHFLRDNVQKGHISIEKVSSIDNIAGILTKPLKRESFNYLRLGLGMMEHIP
ncbi:hypothetical protein Tco_0561121 [Tanacetum coccineum]